MKKGVAVTVRIAHDSNLGEYRAEVWMKRKYLDMPSYYTTDLEDARNTARKMMEYYTKRGLIVTDATAKVVRRTFTAND